VYASKPERHIAAWVLSSARDPWSPLSRVHQRRGVSVTRRITAYDDTS